MDLGRPLFSVLGFGFTFWGFGCVPFSSQINYSFTKQVFPRLQYPRKLYQETEAAQSRGQTQTPKSCGEQGSEMINAVNGQKSFRLSARAPVFFVGSGSI